MIENLYCTQCPIYWKISSWVLAFVQVTHKILLHGKACFSKRPPWRAAADSRLAHGRSLVQAPVPVGALRSFLTLPSFPLEIYIVQIPNHPCGQVKVKSMFVIPTALYREKNLHARVQADIL